MSHDFWLRPDGPDTGGPFACNVIDPPWKEDGGGGRGAQNHYPTLSTSEIAKVILRCPLWRPALDAHIWCWVSEQFHLDGLGLIERLGFKFVRTFVWVKLTREEGKLQQGLGRYARGSHEICLFGTRGRAMLPEVAPPSVIFAERREHSRKPDEAFTTWFEPVSPGPRLEMFARAERPGWVSWGNEVPAKVIPFPVGPDDDTPVVR
jgi:N6-adenosine-specific RNA methylase IME4